MSLSTLWYCQCMTPTTGPGRALPNEKWNARTLRVMEVFLVGRKFLFAPLETGGDRQVQG